MKIYYKYDVDGYYLPGEDAILPPGETLTEERYTDKPPMVNGKGMYKPRFVGGVWVEEGQPPTVETPEPTTEEKVSRLEQENKELKSSVAALEDMIVIMTSPY